ncbi:ankyrin repeat protein [Colletotrichum filicis]|nr:ankyrin repeat protein [Colletotrichum filicis]
MGLRSRVSALFKSNKSSPENNDGHSDDGTGLQTSNPHPEDTTGTTDDHFRSNLNASSRRETESTRDPGRRIAHTAAKKPDASRYGLKILVPVPQSSDKADRVDIVAIHGLNGHREDTWTDPETGLQWLSDSSCLPKDIPGARVLTFGYNSKTYFSRSESDIPDFASELLWALKAQRTTIEERQRRIVFICHSLGGLVFKQAVIMAHEQYRHYSCILDHICGVVFFGTPHRGSSLASWDEIGTLIVKASTLGYVTNSKLSSSLKVDSKFLRRISESFAARGDDFQVRSFYENLRMKGLNCKVVEKESAILNWPKELSIASNANHSDICKFPSPEDPRYKAASLAVHEAVGQTTLGTNLLVDEKNLDFFETLNSDYEDQLHQIDDRIPNTCEWIMSHEIWRQWDSAAGPSLLWITGDAGCGKSVIAKFLIEHFEERNSSSRFHAHVCYFFFKEGLDDQDNASSAVSALIHQILSKQRRLRKRAVDKYRSMPEKDLLHFSTLWSILVAAVQDPNGENTMWVLDGLDECDEKSLEGLIKALAGFMQSQKPAPTIARPACKIILLSRPLNSVERWLRLRSNPSGYNLEKTPGKDSQCFRLSAEEQSASIARDVTLFVKSKISHLGQQSELTAATLRRLEQQLINRADYTFLWVSLVMSIIEEVEVDGISMSQIETILATTKLEDVYEKLLSRRIASLKTRKVLLLILAAVRPLTLDELCVAVEIYQDYHQQEGEEKLERAVKNSKAPYLQENANHRKEDLETNKLDFPTASDSPAPMRSSTMGRQAKKGARTKDLKFSYDYLVQPNTPHFNAWVDIEAWNLRRNGRKPNFSTKETFARREHGLQRALQIFNLWDIDSGGYDEEYIHGSRYWKKNYTVSGDPNAEPDMSEPKAQLPHRVENYRQQHLERMAKEQDPSSPSMGNPTATRSWHH